MNTAPDGSTSASGESVNHTCKTNNSNNRSSSSNGVGVGGGSSSSSSSSSGGGSAFPEDDTEDGVFACNVCLEPVKDKDPVVTQCGHLYCWPCLYRWLNTNHVTCPVCKAGVTTDSVIPLFIRGNTEDPRGKQAAASADGATAVGGLDGAGSIPNRPPGRRLEAPAIPEGGGFAAGAALNDPNAPFGNTGISFSAGFGFFPSLFGLQFQSFAPAPTAGAAAAAQQGFDEDEAQQLYLSRILLLLGASVILCLLFF